MEKEERIGVMDYLLTKGWQEECEVKPEDQVMIVHVNFLDGNEKEDETSFDIKKYCISELESLFFDFCKENDFPNDKVLAVRIIASAPTMEELQNIDM